jgi:uncharacterized protein
MELIEIIGFFSAIAVGIVLGLIGGGGSTLMVPIFVYVFHFSPTQATAYSLLIVAAAAAIGALKQHALKNVAWRTGLLFAVPSLLAVYAMRAYALPAIPDVFELGGSTVSRDLLIMLLFAMLMILAAGSMIRRTTYERKEVAAGRWGLIIAEGFVVGSLTGLVGAGGGFLIIPALVVFLGMPMKQAVGTSLFIIAIKSSVGFIGDLQGGIIEFDWIFAASFSALTLAGVFIGTALSKRIDGSTLQRGFGWFVLVTGVAILNSQLASYWA